MLERSRTQRLVAVGLAAYAAALLVLVWGPWAWALNRLTVRFYVLFRYDWPIAPDWALPEHYGVLLNVALFVPLGALLLVVTRRPWWQVVVAAAGISTAVELAQVVLAREATWVDVASNTAGALLGAGLVGVVRSVSVAVRRPARPSPGATAPRRR